MANLLTEMTVRIEFRVEEGSAWMTSVRRATELGDDGRDDGSESNMPPRSGKGTHHSDDMDRGERTGVG